MAIGGGIGFLLAVSWALAQAPDPQENPSHVPVPALPGNADPEKLFQERLQLAKGLEALRKAHPNLLNPERLKELAKQFQGVDLNDPNLRKLLESRLRDQYQVRLTPEQIEALERLVKEMPARTTEPSQNEPAVSPDRAPDDMRDPASPEQPPEPMNPEDKQRQADAQAETARQLNQLADGFKRLATNLNDSPTLRQTLRDLGAMAVRHAGERPNGGRSDFNNWLTQVNRLGNDSDNWLAKNWPHMRSLDFPRLTAPQWTSPSLPWRRPEVPGLPSGSSSGGAVSSFWQPVLTVVLVVSLIVALVKLLSRSLRKRGEADNDAWELGPWPVNPAEVRSRADLIRTFEYFSLLRLGRQARTWNHRAIARSLADEHASEAQAAAALAALYEQARYAPSEELLSAEALAAYRRDLCFLAGVAAT